MSYDPKQLKITRKSGKKDVLPTRPHRVTFDSHKRPLIITKCDQEITSPMCYVNDNIYGRDKEDSITTLCSEISTDFPHNFNYSAISQSEYSCFSETQAQINTNYMTKQCPCTCCDPSSIDKCTELEAMRRGLARIQAGHGRPSDFLPDKRKSSYEKYDELNPNDIRRSITEANGPKQSAVENGNTEAQLTGLMKEIRQSIVKLNDSEPAFSNDVMGTLQEIRNGIQYLTNAIKDVQVEVNSASTVKQEDVHVIEALGEIQRDLRTLLGFSESENHFRRGQNEQKTVMGAINDIRSSIKQLKSSAEEEEENQAAEEIIEAIGEIRQSVRAMAKQNPDNQHYGTNEDGINIGKSETAMDRLTSKMTRSIEELQKSIEKISEHLLNGKKGENALSDSDKEKNERKEGKKKHKKKIRQKSDSESDFESDDSQDCCKDSCRLEKTCDKIIDFLISNEKKSGSHPQIQLLMPNQPPRFMAPFFRHPLRSQMTLPLPPPPANSTPIPPRGSIPVYPPASNSYAYQSSHALTGQRRCQPYSLNQNHFTQPDRNLPPPQQSFVNGIAVPQMTSSNDSAGSSFERNNEQPVLYRATATDERPPSNALTLNLVASSDSNGPVR